MQVKNVKIQQGMFNKKWKLEYKNKSKNGEEQKKVFKISNIESIMKNRTIMAVMQSKKNCKMSKTFLSMSRLTL